ncbi:MAG: 50S ribosomal protein L19 [Bacteroidetes bacterium]|nr:50S ribosomal protein L19 [Bacteroidota bacterium]
MTKTAIKLTPVDVDSRKKLDVRTGDTVRVFSKIKEKGKTRLQAFEGLVLARKHGTETGATLTVRKVSDGIGVERIFPLFSPLIDRIELVKRSKTRRSKLYFLRDKTNKEIRKKLKGYGIEASETKEVASEEMMDEVVEEPKEEKTAE